MRRRPSLLCVSLAALAVALVVCAVRHERGIKDLQTEWDRKDELHDQEAVFHYQCAASEAVVDRLVTGELSLKAALAELETINQSRLTALCVTVKSHAGDQSLSDREVLAWYAINKVHRRAPADPKVHRDTVSRLEGEYRALFDRAAPTVR